MEEARQEFDEIELKELLHIFRIHCWNSFQREFVQNGQLIQIEPGQLFPELSHTTVKVGTMRAIFGSYVEISGEISANGRTLSLTERIQLTAE